MAYNKIVYSGETLLDLTNDTLETSSQLLNGIKAHSKDGNIVTGNLVIQHYYTGSSDPSPSLGQDGDIYLKA